MKHIKRKFLFHDFLQNEHILENFEHLDKSDVTENILKKNAKEGFIIIETDLNQKIFSFAHKENGKHCMIPVPDFSLVNYNFAYNLNIQRKEYRKNLVENLSDTNIYNEVSNTFAYDFQGCASTCIICLFTAIECFINDIIPENFIYEIKNTRKTETYNKSQIQISISFTDKLTKVLPKALNKNFFLESTPTNFLIYNLRDLRNDIIHIKSDNTGQNNVDILKRLLNFRYDDTLVAVFKFFNFYKKGFIEECPCENNW